MWANPHDVCKIAAEFGNVPLKNPVLHAQQLRSGREPFPRTKNMGNRLAQSSFAQGGLPCAQRAGRFLRCERPTDRCKLVLANHHNFVELARNLTGNRRTSFFTDNPPLAAIQVGANPRRHAGAPRPIGASAVNSVARIGDSKKSGTVMGGSISNNGANSATGWQRAHWRRIRPCRRSIGPASNSVARPQLAP